MQTKCSEVDFRGQDIYVGIDVGKRSWKVCIVTEYVEHRVFTQVPSPAMLANYLHRTFPGARYHSAYEAGFSGFWAHEELQALGIDSRVVNPADVPTTQKEKSFKTDRIDARKLARSLRSGELRPIYVPPQEAQTYRSLVRLRSVLVRDQTRCKNQITSLLHYYGVPIDELCIRTHWSRAYLRVLETTSLHTEQGTMALRILLSRYYAIRDQVLALTKEIRTLAHEEPFRESIRVLVTVPGISVITAMVLLTELIDITRFASLDHLASYCGLVPGERSSGEREIITGITRRRNPFLRAILIESAWCAVRHDPALLAMFGSLSKRMNKNRAIVRIARKLLNRIRFVLLHHTEYQRSLAA
jgi:transposase